MKLKHLITVFCLCALFIAPAAAAGGSGTAASPYIIETAAELQAINNDLSAYYQLANDIDLSGVTWTPIGSTTLGFHGTLDGNDKTISNLNLSSTAQSAGLFRSLTSGATIKDLTLEDCHVESTASWCGCLVGSIIMSESAHETATLQDIDMVRCSATSSGDIVGVLCGFCTGGSRAEIIGCTVTTSHATASGAFVSALYGSCSSGSRLIITDCSVDTCIAESISSSTVSILCGICDGGSSVYAENCTAENSIAIGTYYVGGIFSRSSSTGSSIGATDCTVKECTVVATQNYAGGIAGRVVSGATGVFTNCTVTDCSILATAYAAGVCPAYS